MFKSSPGNTPLKPLPEGYWPAGGKAEIQLQWLEALPQLNGEIHRFEGVGHFVEEHRPESIATEIRHMIHHFKGSKK